ncbi:MAG TPA: hypothetical protein VNE59_00465 [Burkholderiales bacterium]|nr:hypothetical protein [Burkholderiales bacterium]
MRVLVTGGSGFIGGHLCPALPGAAHALGVSVQGCGAEVHPANIAHTSASAPELQRANVEGTIEQAKAALGAGVGRSFTGRASRRISSPRCAPLIAAGHCQLASIHTRRSLVYVGNLVDAILRCLEASARGKAFAVSDGTPIPRLQLCRALG